MRWFTDPEILILASPEEFIFRGSTDEIRVAPVLWLDPAGERVEWIGDGQRGGSAKRVEIFGSQPDEPDVSRARLLTMLLRYGLSEIIGKSVFALKPVVRFGPLDAFDSILGGFQRDVFERAALEAGAKRVRFD